jgi:hypothetical protein
MLASEATFYRNAEPAAGKVNERLISDPAAFLKELTVRRPAGSSG